MSSSGPRCRGSLASRGSSNTVKRGSVLLNAATGEHRLMASSGIQLEHGDRLAFGYSLYFYADPSITLPELLISTGQVSYLSARKELYENHWKSSHLKFMQACGGPHHEKRMSVVTEKCETEEVDTRSDDE